MCAKLEIPFEDFGRPASDGGFSPEEEEDVMIFLSICAVHHPQIKTQVRKPADHTPGPQADAHVSALSPALPGVPIVPGEAQVPRPFRVLLALLAASALPS